MDEKKGRAGAQSAPAAAQTGPAIRKDQKTINKHLALLNKQQQEIYTTITKSIQNGN